MEALGEAAARALEAWVEPLTGEGEADGIASGVAATELPGLRIERIAVPLSGPVEEQLILPGARCSGKVTHVALEGEGLMRTGHLLLFTRGRPGAWLDRKVACEVLWKLAGDALPVMQSIVIQSMETVTSQGRLEDFTDIALGDHAKSPALARSNTYWRNHLEQAKRPGLFGQNGLAVADLDGDGLDDLYHCQLGGVRNEVFLQLGDGRFTLADERCGLDFLDESRAALFVDFDNDGDQDCALATVQGVAVFANDGSGSFAKAFSIDTDGAAHSLAAADFDSDGDLDLFVCGYYGRDQDTNELPVPHPIFDATNGGPNLLLRHEGGLRFADVTDAAGLGKDNRRYSFAALWEDFDNDGDPDLYTANDFGRDTLHRNDGGTFVDISAAAGLNRGAFGMGVTSADYDHDGNMDIYVANMFSAAGSRLSRQEWFKSGQPDAVRASYRHLARGNTLLKNLGGGGFADVSVALGAEMGRFAWGVQFADLNNDSWEDLLVANGYVTGREPDDL